MKNTGITYTSAERSPVILPEMAELLPPLSAEQSAALEEDLLRNGCYSPVIVNEDMVIVDGHNRQSLCEKHGLPYTMAVFSFEDLLEAKQWALDTQKGRRNLEKWELGKIALKLKPEIEAKARANQGTRTDLSATLPESSDTVDTRKELAEAVGLGERTMGKVMQIDENAPEVIRVPSVQQRTFSSDGVSRTAFSYALQKSAAIFPFRSISASCFFSSFFAFSYSSASAAACSRCSSGRS